MNVITFGILSSLFLFHFLTHICEDAYAQTVSGEPSGSITIKSKEIFEVGLKLKEGESVSYAFDADRTLLFDIHSHDGNRIETHVLKESTVFDGVFFAPKNGDYYFLSMNLGWSEATLQYYISLAYNTHSILYEDIQYVITTSSNSSVEVVGFEQENKRMLIRMQTPYLTPGFINLTIPRTLIDGSFDLYGSLIDYRYWQNDTMSTFIIKTTAGIHDISITGTYVVPETPVPLLLMVVMMTVYILMIKLKKVFR
ncbi:MAG: hypothetical protein QXU32_03575 [Nitrososphaerales archaeon]